MKGGRPPIPFRATEVYIDLKQAVNSRPLDMESIWQLYHVLARMLNY